MQNEDAIPMLLWCPQCGKRHIDEGEYEFKPHHTHACQKCGMVWRPAIIVTTGVQFLPGFKNGEEQEEENEEKEDIIVPDKPVKEHIWNTDTPPGRRYCIKCGEMEKTSKSSACTPLIRKSNEPPMDRS